MCQFQARAFNYMQTFQNTLPSLKVNEDGFSVGFGPEVGVISGINSKLTLPEPLMFGLVVVAVILTFVAFFSYLPPALKQIKENIKKK